MTNPVPFHPWFYRDDAERILSPQQPIFGLYAYATMVRSVLCGLRFFEAGNLLKDQRYYAGAIALHYTAAFHLLDGLLAAHGRVPVKPVGQAAVVEESGRAYGTHEPVGRAGLVLGRLTRNGTWAFEGRHRDHVTRWGELKTLTSFWQSEDSAFFDRFLRYLCSYFGDLIVDEADLITEGLARLSAGRHESIYDGYGYDDTASDIATNGGIVPGSAFGLRAEEYARFSRALLLHNAATLGEVREFAGTEIDAVRSTLLAIVFSRPFEMGLTAQDDELEDVLSPGIWWIREALLPGDGS